MRTRSFLVAVVVAGLGAVGCTTPQAPTTASTPTATSSPSSASPSASTKTSTAPTPSPSQTLDANQAAAVAAVKGSWAANAKIGADPSAFTRAQMTAELGRYLGGDVVEGQVGYLAGLKAKGYRLLGETTAVWVKASDVADNHSSRGLEVHVTVCQDQTALQLVDKGAEPLADQPADFNLRQYSVRKPAKESRWRIYGVMSASGECGR